MECYLEKKFGKQAFYIFSLSLVANILEGERESRWLFAVVGTTRLRRRNKERHSSPSSSSSFLISIDLSEITQTINKFQQYQHIIIIPNGYLSEH